MGVAFKGRGRDGGVLRDGGSGSAVGGGVAVVEDVESCRACSARRGAGGGGVFFLDPPLVVFTLLSVTHEGFDRVHVLCNDSLIDVIRLKVSKESKPGWVYTRRREPSLRIVAHMLDVHEGSRGWARDKRLVDGTSFRYTLLLCRCCDLCVCCVTESVGVARIRRTTYV